MAQRNGKRFEPFLVDAFLFLCRRKSLCNQPNEEGVHARSFVRSKSGDEAFLGFCMSENMGMAGGACIFSG